MVARQIGFAAGRQPVPHGDEVGYRLGRDFLKILGYTTTVGDTSRAIFTEVAEIEMAELGATVTKRVDFDPHAPTRHSIT